MYWLIDLLVGWLVGHAIVSRPWVGGAGVDQGQGEQAMVERIPLGGRDSDARCFPQDTCATAELS